MEVISILIAKTADGKLIILAEKNAKEDLKKMREQLMFYCPQCDEKVILKIGDVKIPHFAHGHQTTCQTLFTEGESAVHLAGKQQLYTFFQQNTPYDVQLEPYVKELAQRPDLLIETATEKHPIEFQCSHIPVSLIAARTKGYHKAGMRPIWLLQTPKKLLKNPQGVINYSLSRFEESFLTQNLFMTYNAHSKKFHYVSGLLHIEGRKFIVNHRKLSIDHQPFPFARPNPLTEAELETYYVRYSTARRQFLRNRILYNRKGIRDPFLRNCYRLRLIPSELPEWIGVPLTFGMMFKEHNCEWQLALLAFITTNQLKMDEIQMQDLREFGYAYGNVESGALDAYQKYIQVLRKLGITSMFDSLAKGELKKVLLECLQKEVKIEKM